MKLKFPIVHVISKKNGFMIDVSFYNSLKAWQSAKVINRMRKKSQRVMSTVGYPTHLNKEISKLPTHQ